MWSKPDTASGQPKEVSVRKWVCVQVTWSFHLGDKVQVNIPASPIFEVLCFVKKVEGFPDLFPSQILLGTDCSCHITATQGERQGLRQDLKMPVQISNSEVSTFSDLATQLLLIILSTRFKRLLCQKVQFTLQPCPRRYFVKERFGYNPKTVPDVDGSWPSPLGGRVLAKSMGWAGPG